MRSSTDQWFIAQSRVWIRVVAAAIFSASTTLVAAAEFNFTYAGYASPEISAGATAQWFADEVKKRSNGRIDIKTYHRGSLCSENKCLEQATTGGVHFAASATSSIGTYTRQYDWINLPFMVSPDIEKGPKQWTKMINSPIGKEIQAKAEKETGFKLLFLMSSNGGGRVILSRSKPVVVPNDIKGMKVRVSLAPIDLIIHKHWGANAIPVPWSETLTGFSSGTFDVVELGVPHVHSVGFDEIGKQMTMLSFQYPLMGMWVTTDFWNRLPKDVQALLTEVAAEAVVYEHNIDLVNYKKVLEAIKKRGVTITYPTPAQLALWEKASEGVYSDPEVTKHMPAAVIEQLRKAGK